MKDIKNNCLLEEEDHILSHFFEPILNRAAEQLKIDLPLSDPFRQIPKEEEVRASYHSFLSNHLYDQNERCLIMKGFDTVIENLPRVKGGEHAKQEILQIGNQLLDLSEEMLSQNKSLMNSQTHYAPLGISLNNVAAEKAIRHFLDYFEERGKTGVSPEVLSSISEMGNKLFEEHKLEEAASVFQFLSLLAPTCHEIWFSLALCHHHLKLYPEAMANYSMAILTNGWDIQAFINLALCYKAVNDRENMLETLHLAEGMIDRSSLSASEKELWNQALKQLEATKSQTP